MSRERASGNISIASIVRRKNCPLITGRCGMAGGGKNLDRMTEGAKERSTYDAELIDEF
jgi:hypothetical protein